jgi:ATP-binding cassette ChvD family protein
MLGLNKYYGQKQVLKDIYLSFYPGAKIGIVGENGSGKSTVLKIMAGLDTDFQGKAELSKGYTSGMVAQEPVLDGELTVRETIELAFPETIGFLNEYENLSVQMAEPMSDDKMQKLMDRMGELQDKLDASDAWNIDQHISQASEALVLPDDNRLIKTLSGGEKRRVALCKALLEHPDLLLLDEPTNHLDPETVDWLEARLKEYEGTVIIVTHDRYFLDNITKWILELDNGSGIPYEGNYSSWLQQKLEKIMAENKKDNIRYRALERELAWIKMNGKDRSDLSRNRLASYEKLVAMQSSDEDEVIQIAPGPELGTQVIEFDNVSKSYGDNVLIKELVFAIPRGAVIGVIGPNGAGKTTLFNMIRGAEKSDTGDITLGASVKLAYVDQERQALEGDKSLIDEIGEGASEVLLGKRTVPIRQYVSRFGFKGSDQQKTVKELSGGERNRCNLAKILKVGGNVLLLDEPTNDLDVNTLRLLEEAVQNFKGCVLIISHDRFFLDRICTNMLVFEGDGFVRWFEGNYREYEEWRIKELGGKLFENRRNRYRRLPRK